MVWGAVSGHDLALVVSMVAPSTIYICIWERIVSLRACDFLGKSLQLQPRKYDRLSKNTIWHETSYASSCPSRKTFRWEFFKSPPQISVPYVKVESILALNKWDLSSQHVTPTISSFLKVLKRLSYVRFFVPFTRWLKVSMWIKSIPLCLMKKFKVQMARLVITIEWWELVLYVLQVVFS